MEPGLWQREEDLVQRALELDECRRAEFLGSSCRGDEALRREVESLLAQENKVNHFLKRMTSSSVAAKANGIACKAAGRGPGKCRLCALGFERSDEPTRDYPT